MEIGLVAEMLSLIYMPVLGCYDVVYGIALPDKRAFVNACIGSAVGGLVISITGASIYISSSLGVFNWLLFIPPAGVESPNYILWAIIASAVSAIVGFAIEFATYRPEKVRAAA